MEMYVDYVGPDPLKRQRHVPQEHPPDVEVDTRDESKDLPGDTLVRSPVFDSGENMDVPGNQAHIVSGKPARRAKRKVRRIRKRQGGSRYVRPTGESCILTPEGYQIVCDSAGEEFRPDLNPLPKFQGDHASKPNLCSTCSRRQQKNRMRMLTRHQNVHPMGYFVPWTDHTLFLHPKGSEIAGIVKKCRWDGARGVIVVPVRTKETWFWSLGEVTVNWWDLPRDEPIFQDVQGGQHMQEPDTQYRAIAFDWLGDQQQGVNRTDWKRRPGYNLDSEGGFQKVFGTPTSHKGQNIHSPQQSSNLFGKRLKGTDRKRWRLKCHKLALLGQGPVDTPDPELAEESCPLMPEHLVQLRVEEMNARRLISTNGHAKRFLSGAPRWIPYSESPYRSWDPTWRPLLTTLFQDRERSVRSVIEADGELLGELATELRNRIY